MSKLNFITDSGGKYFLNIKSCQQILNFFAYVQMCGCFCVLGRCSGDQAHPRLPERTHRRPHPDPMPGRQVCVMLLLFCGGCGWNSCLLFLLKMFDSRHSFQSENIQMSPCLWKSDLLLIVYHALHSCHISSYLVISAPDWSRFRKSLVPMWQTSVWESRAALSAVVVVLCLENHSSSLSLWDLSLCLFVYITHTHTHIKLSAVWVNLIFPACLASTSLCTYTLTLISRISSLTAQFFISRRDFQTIDFL